MIGRRRLAAILGLLTLATVSACTSSDSVTAADKRETESTLAAAMTALSDAAKGGHPPLRPCRQRSNLGPMRRSNTRPLVPWFLVCRVLGSDAGQGVDPAVA
jgi:hypothetical protein